jgi:hypothetical protein
MKTKLAFVVLACVTLSVSGCGSSPRSRVVGKWETGLAKDGKAKLTMFGEDARGTYRNGLATSVSRFQLRLGERVATYTGRGMAEGSSATVTRSQACSPLRSAQHSRSVGAATARTTV